jgi:hypothetical protein
MNTKLTLISTRNFRIILFILILQPHITFSQNEYFESGAVWHHQFTSFFSPNGYSKTFVNGSQMVAGVQSVKLSGEKSYKELTSPTTYFYSGIVPLPDLYMRSSNDSVFIFREGAFYLAYKTNAVVGEVWDLGPNVNYTNLQDNHSYLRVDLVYYKNVNGENLRHINAVSCMGNGSDFPFFANLPGGYLFPLYGGVFNEKYGPSKNFREMEAVGFADTNLIIDYYQNQFLCYQSDSTAQLSITPNADCVQQVYLGVEEEAKLFTVSPNPSNGIFDFQNLSNSELELMVHDSQGRIIMVLKSRGDFNIDLSAYSSGSYFAHVRSAHSVQTIRFVNL